MPTDRTRELLVVAGVLALVVAAAAPAVATAGADRPSGACRAGVGGDAAARPANLSLETFVAPGASYDRLTSPAALRAARADGTLTPASVGVELTYEDEVVAYRDVVVHRVALRGSATALADRLAAANGSGPTERFRSLLANGSVSLAYHGPSACPPELAVNASFDAGAIRVVPAPANDTVAFVLDVDRLRFHPLGGGEPTTDTRVLGHHFFGLALPAGGLVETAARIEAGYEVDRAAAELAGPHEGLIRVEPAADQRLEGRTTLAPGSQVTVTLVPYVGDAERVTVRTTVDRSRRFAVAVDLDAVPNGAIYAVGFGSITEPPVVRAGSTFVAVGNATGAIVSLRNQNSTGRILYGPALTTTHGGFVTVRNGAGRLVGVSDYREPGAAVAQIDLGPPLDADQRVTVTVYRDVNDNRVYDDADVPYRANGSPVRDAALVQLKRDGQPTNPRSPATTAPGTLSPASPSSRTTAPSKATTTPGQPGFGFGLALLGVLLTLGLAARRRR